MQTNNHQIVDYDLVLDKKFGNPPSGNPITVRSGASGYPPSENPVTGNPYMDNPVVVIVPPFATA